MAKVLVTGGAGYIGSRTVIELVCAGYQPILVDNFCNRSSDIIGRLTKIQGFTPKYYNIDLCALDSVRKLADSEPDIDAIIHFAAYKAVAESVEEPLKYYHNNLVSLLNLLEIFKDAPMKFIFSSTCTVYGEIDICPVTEDAPRKVSKSPYGRTKQIAEEILETVSSKRANLRVISLRYFNSAGGHPSGTIGDNSLGPPQNLIPCIAEAAIGKQPELTVHGNDYNTHDGTAVRDYVHVMDVARAHVAALKKLESDNFHGSFHAFNLGTGIGNSVMDVVNAFEISTDVRVNYHFGPRRAGDVEQIWADCSKAKFVLGWQACETLNDMVLSAWKWEQYLDNKQFDCTEIDEREDQA